MSQQETVVRQRHWNSHQRPSDEDVLEALRLYKEGWSQKEIGRKFNRAQSGINRWIHEYAPLVVNKDMKTNDNNGKGEKRAAGLSAEKPRRVTGAIAPETAAVHESKEESLEQKVKRLERELKDAELMRDFYDEMINVAEKQFNVPIRKKAGTRR